MTIQPRNNKLFVQFHSSKGSTLILPDGVKLNADNTRIEVLAVSDTLEHLYDVGDFLMLYTQVNIFPVNQKEKTGLIDASGVLAVVKYDEALEA